MDEFSLIKLIKQDYYQQSTLIKGVGDDAAVFRQTSQDIVTAVDTFVENVHFSRQTMLPFDIGYRALAANISDLAAMGAVPAFYLISITIPKNWSTIELEDIFNGMKMIAKDYKMDLIGGDTVSGKELTISITVLGYVEKAKARYRSLAHHDDVVFVTGTLGDSQAGLHILLNDDDYIDKEHYIKCHRRPAPRIGFALALSHLSRVCLNDISDGIANEAGEISEDSKVNIVLFDEEIPVSPSFNQFPQSLQDKWKYFGGEDFELIGTVSRKDFKHVIKAAKETNILVTEIGYTEYSESGKGKVFLKKNNQKRILKKDGYIHLK